MIKNNLLYSYDDENKKISPLPASPYLLPAVIVYVLLWAGSCISSFFNRSSNTENVTKTMGLTYETWRPYRDRYICLIDKKNRQGLTPNEARELARVQYPPWAKHGEVWTYK